MKFFSAVLLATAVSSAPLSRRGFTDVDVLQYALTLEHLENEFYKGALNKLSKQDFLDAGYTADYYNNLQYIAHDEEAHVEALTAGLTAAGATPVAACDYSFPYTDPKSFIALSGVLEGVGTAAYLGGAPIIQSKEYLGIAGAILITEALHTSLQRYVQNLVAPANPYGTALGVNEVYTLAAAFITKCPSTNAVLPLKKFPSLTAVTATPAWTGETFVFEVSCSVPSWPLYVTFLSGLSITSVPATYHNGKITTQIPSTASGQSYAVLTSANVTTALTDSVVLAGPAIVEVTPGPPTYNDSIL